MSKQLISLTQYVAANNPSASIALLDKYNLKPNNTKGIEEGLALIIKKYRETGLAQVANLLPEKNLILALFNGEKKSNCSGCSHGADAGTTTTTPPEVKHSWLPRIDANTFIFGAAILITLSVVLSTKA